MIEPRISSSSARCLVQSCIWGWAWLARPEVILALGSEVLLKEHKHGWKGLCLCSQFPRFIATSYDTSTITSSLHLSFLP